MQDRFRDIRFDMEEISVALTEEERGPYQNVFMQECVRMNILTDEINRSLTELDMGLSGALTRNARMEALESALFINRVPVTWVSTVALVDVDRGLADNGYRRLLHIHRCVILLRGLRI